jgi:uncharacterized protein YecE (DUF72 family)
MKKLRGVETPLANFFASGVLVLCEKLGPILWQLPPNLGWNKERVSQLKERAWTKIDISWPLRYATSRGGQIFQPFQHTSAPGNNVDWPIDASAFKVAIQPMIDENTGRMPVPRNGRCRSCQKSCARIR